MTSEEIQRFESCGFKINENNGIVNVLNKTKQVYNYTGADQFFEVPRNVSYIFVKIWGAGGSAGLRGGWSVGALGGGGGFSMGLFLVRYGEILTIKVGEGGYTNKNGRTYGGGGGLPIGYTVDARYCGQGGGGSFIFRDSTTPLLISGGGGGGGVTASGGLPYNHGGAGGGIVGAKAYGSTLVSGNGGTQSSGGATTPTALYVTGDPGSLYLGGNVGFYPPNAATSYGAAGGGGYYGGSAGSYSNDASMGGGGGGSGFVAPYAIYGLTEAGSGQFPAYRLDSELPQTYSGQNAFLGHGGFETMTINAQVLQSGGHGLCVIYY